MDCNTIPNRKKVLKWWEQTKKLLDDEKCFFYEVRYINKPILKEEKMSDTKKPTYEEKLEALRESIKHWEEVAEDPENASTGSKYCALCIVAGYKEHETSPDCTVCPVYEKTGESNCDETPWDNWAVEETKENAQAEVIFLKNLLIEMLEGETPELRDKKEEKKKEKPKEEKWVDITEELTWRTEFFSSEHTYWLIGALDEAELVYLCYSGVYLYNDDLEDNIRIEKEERESKEDWVGFRILKKT